MNKSCRNIYKIARESAGITREYASELLNVSTRTLTYYESDKEDFVRPTGETVDKMVNTYKAEWLAYMHGVLATETGKKSFPRINMVDLARGVLTLQSYIDAVLVHNSKITTIAMVGVIDEDEQEDWKEISQDISKLAGDAMSLVIGKYEKSPSELQLQRA